MVGAPEDSCGVHSLSTAARSNAVANRRFLVVVKEVAITAKRA